MKYGYLKIHGGCRPVVRTFGCDPKSVSSKSHHSPKNFIFIVKKEKHHEKSY